MLTDWLMVIITFVYVVATIFICMANIKSAKATREQLAESKRQFDESNRPRIEVELVYERKMWYALRFINHGTLTAQNVKIELSQEFIDSINETTIKTELIRSKNKEGIIGVGQHYDLFIGSNKLRENKAVCPVKGKIYYRSNENEYSDDFFIDLEHYMTFYSIRNESEDLINAIKENTKQLKSIKEAISISEVIEEE